MALVGNLKDLKLANIVQLNCMEKNEALFTVEHFNTVGKIYFAEGNIVHATYGQTEGEEAVYRILQIKEGAFKVENGVPTPKRSINNSWSNVLLEGMRLIDEAMEAKSDVVTKLAKELKNVNGVNGVLVSNGFGEILMEEGIANGKRASAAMAFVVRKFEKIGRASKFGAFKSVVVTGKNDKRMTGKFGDDVVDVSLDMKASTDLIEQTIEKTKAQQV